MQFSLLPSSFWQGRHKLHLHWHEARVVSMLKPSFSSIQNVELIGCVVLCYCVTTSLYVLTEPIGMSRLGKQALGLQLELNLAQLNADRTCNQSQKHRVFLPPQIPVCEISTEFVVDFGLGTTWQIDATMALHTAGRLLWPDVRLTRRMIAKPSSLLLHPSHISTYGPLEWGL